MLSEKEILELTSLTKLKGIYYLKINGKKELVFEFDNGSVYTLQAKEIEKLKEVI